MMVELEKVINSENPYGMSREALSHVTTMSGGKKRITIDMVMRQRHSLVTIKVRVRVWVRLNYKLLALRL
jgi:hypothetical protein